jgi:hypothetical protein
MLAVLSERAVCIVRWAQSQPSALVRLGACFLRKTGRTRRRAAYPAWSDGCSLGFAASFGLLSPRYGGYQIDCPATYSLVGSFPDLVGQAWRELACGPV